MSRHVSKFAVVLALVASTFQTLAAAPSAIPPNILATDNKPMVMLSASKDFTMFWKAYTDFDDIDFDGVVDRTFMANFRYYGYFDPVKCYTYSSANSRFEPSRLADQSDRTTINGVERVKYYCTPGANEWSGNFLNWATMSRIDILRKVLYGGMRSEDTADSTTLELSFVPRNSQAFVKYYNGADLNKLTSYNTPDALARGITTCRKSASPWAT
jgi:type IV pilus assembly protein PilY1